MTLRRYTPEELASCIVKPDGHVPSAARFNIDLLWSITAIAPNDAYGGTRTVAVCDNFWHAKAIVESNEGDIWESSYMLVVIEQFHVNHLYGGFDKRDAYWYRWNLAEACYEAIETPVFFASATGFAVG